MLPMLAQQIRQKRVRPGTAAKADTGPHAQPNCSGRGEHAFGLESDCHRVHDTRDAQGIVDLVTG
jgi:hypothetical protein